MQIYFYWLISGLIFLFLETFLPGIGMLFLGIASIFTGMILSFDHVHLSLLMQFAVCFSLTAITALILWKPLKKYHTKSSHKYYDVIGKEAQIYENDLSKNSMGKVKWSGTIFNANIEPNEPYDIIPMNNRVIIVKIEGNILIVRKK